VSGELVVSDVASGEGTTALESVESFRQRAHEWMSANLDRRDPGTATKARGAEHKTVEGIAIQRRIQRELHAAGFAGIAWPGEFGGQGLSDAHQRAFDEESASFELPDLGISGVVTRIVCANVMLAHASDEFNRRHLPRIASGDELWVEFFSEPSAGSDLAAVTTTAIRDGDHWVLNGNKIWTSGAYYADFGMCLARTDWDVPKHRGLTWFAVPTNAPGVTVTPLKEITGDMEFCEESFVDVMIADTERIGDVNDGWSVAQTALLFEREASSGSLTTAPVRRDAPPLAPDLVTLARRAGRLDDAHVRQLIAKAHIFDFALTQLGIRVGTMMRLDPVGGAAYVGYTKLAAGTYEPIRARMAAEIAGGRLVAWAQGDPDGIVASLGILNSRVTAIAGGSNEMQRNGIGERVLGLPREPNVDKDKPFRDIAHREGPR
jgi:alkylation response protein AidB-like acyl-CoA dehydrogenase